MMKWPVLQGRLHNRVLAQAGVAENTRETMTRTHLLREWLQHESPYHWGTNKAAKSGPYQQTPFRMTEGGDEHGSLSFSQLVYPNRYGADSACAALTATDINPYSPEGQVKIIATFLGSEPTDNHSCSGGMNMAFVEDTLGRSYADVPDLVRIQGQNTLGNTEDDYEKLAKAIFVYNAGEGNAWVSGRSRHSWPYIIRNLVYSSDSATNNQDSGVCHSCKYSIQIRERAFGNDNLRTYIWEGDDANHDGQPDWCFEYGEREWVSGTLYSVVAQNAADTDDRGNPHTPQGRINCTTGNPI